MCQPERWIKPVGFHCDDRLTGDSHPFAQLFLRKPCFFPQFLYSIPQMNTPVCHVNLTPGLYHNQPDMSSTPYTPRSENGGTANFTAFFFGHSCKGIRFMLYCK